MSGTDDALLTVSTVGGSSCTARLRSSITKGIVPRGTPDESSTGGYSVMLGYWGDGRSAEAIDKGRLRMPYRRSHHHRRGWLCAIVGRIGTW